MKKIYGAFTVFLAVALFASFLISCSDDDKYTEPDDLPIATDDVSTYTAGNTAVINILDNDTTGDLVNPASVSLVNGSDTDSNGTLDRREITGEGIWTVNATGVLTFTPAMNFYQVQIQLPTLFKIIKEIFQMQSNGIIDRYFRRYCRFIFSSLPKTFRLPIFCGCDERSKSYFRGFTI
ncbi:hypothetical protein H9X57_15835 [Flavobacterium piscinae]|uniref:Ig-like domain-containing protein n=1 Tax=Flavobacterium piscinae TaxID=2506424 RepID=UPI0019A10B85|nr:Ig-like domain-containing protein [Flavobacterium piscinae]MBC8884319.1 hypothetical protein [Flavobacterium piscinae]